MFRNERTIEGALASVQKKANFGGKLRKKVVFNGFQAIRHHILGLYFGEIVVFVKQILDPETKINNPFNLLVKKNTY